MADVEMDLDPTRAMGHDDHINEDVIEYDLDTDILDGNDKDWATQDLDIQDVDGQADPSIDAHDHMETVTDDAIENDTDAMDTLDPLPLSGTSANDADMLSDLGHPDHVAEEDAMPEDEPIIIEDTVVDTAPVDVDPSGSDNIQGEHAMQEGGVRTDDQVEEIDFGAAPEESLGDPQEPNAEDAAVSTGVLESETVTDHDKIQTQASAPKVVDENLPANTTAVPAAEEELTWEEDEEDDTVEAQKSMDNAQSTENEQHIELGHDDEPPATNQEAADGEEQWTHQERTESETEEALLDDAEHEIGEHGGNAQQTDLSEEGAVTAESPHVEVPEEETTKEVHEEKTEMPEAVQDESQEVISYPSITVQYKGEEFPCFAASEGFFTSTSVLTESMEMLLAWFRAELAEEIAPDEELVFHIDELGLEFSESSQHDLLSATTLQYIMEIHDMLVQNQDHDDASGAKTLYTYLFTRSSTSKRLEFLAESAAAGKGLDEVIHLFEPGMTHPEDGTDDSLENTPDALEYLGDDFPSPGDEQPEGDVIEAEEGQEEAADDIPDVSFDDLATGAVPDSRGIVDTSSPGAGQQSVPLSGGNEYSPEVAESSTVPSAPAQNETETHESYEASELEVHDASVDQTEHADDHAQGMDLPLTTTTSTSSTVDGNDLTSASASGEVIEVADDDTANIQPANDVEEDIVEIDWREDGDLEEAHDVADDQTTPAKRARTEDELGVVQENDSKRQRSS